jgi:hypothetical protein
VTYNKRDPQNEARNTVSVTEVDVVPTNKSAETQDRTGDLQIFSLTLSQLSYRGLATGGRLPGANSLCVTTTHRPRSQPRGSTVSFIEHSFVAPLDTKVLGRFGRVV